MCSALFLKNKYGVKFSISKKKVDTLYSAVHEEIVQVRVKIGMQLNSVPAKDRIEEIENWLAELTYKAPEEAIKVFVVQNKLKK